MNLIELTNLSFIFIYFYFFLLSTFKKVKMNGDSEFIFNNNESEVPWEIQEVDRELNKQLLKDFKGEKSGFIRMGPNKYFFPEKFAQETGSFYHFTPRPTDTWVITFPRSGTTWTQEMVWLLSNDLDYSTAAKYSLRERFPFFEFSACVNTDLEAEYLAILKNDEEKTKKFKKVCSSVIPSLDATTGPRFIKTHLPFSLLSPSLLECGAKIIYVARNPKDVAVSYYHLNRLIKTLDFTGDFTKFWDYFEKDLHLWCPYWSHINEAWELRNHSNVLFLFYEDMKQNLKSTIQTVATFLNKKYTEEEISTLSSHLDISNFRKNSSVNMEGLKELGMLNVYDHRFIRKGESGGWKEMFTDELNDKADKWIRKNLENTDLRFPITF